MILWQCGLGWWEIEAEKVKTYKKIEEGANQL
jgi:hypothetical protein